MGWGMNKQAVIEEYRNSLHYLYSFQKFGIKLGLSKIRKLLSSLDYPHHGLQAVHIAGSNGKGSTAAMITSILTKAGYRVGLFTSPHLVTFRERIRIGDELISMGNVIHLVDKLRKLLSIDDPPTFFEVVTAMAFLYFRQEEVDIAIFETGMGGRLDATNLIQPLVTVITTLSLEHKEYLGPTLLDIAREKAGIIKPNIELVTSVRQKKLIEYLSQACRKNNAPFLRLGKEFKLKQHNSLFDYHGSFLQIKSLETNLLGRHQRTNAATALATIEVLMDKGFQIREEDIREGLKTVFWPGRLEKVKRSPLILLDGAHNPEAARTLAKTIKEEFPQKDIALLIGIMNDKDIKGILKPLLSIANNIVFTRPTYPRSADPALLFTIGKEILQNDNKNRTLITIPNLWDAIDYCLKNIAPEEILLITGSLFTVGEARVKLLPDHNLVPDEGITFSGQG